VGGFQFLRYDLIKGFSERVVAFKPEQKCAVKAGLVLFERPVQLLEA
jgi:hypothetical protein